MSDSVSVTRDGRVATVVLDRAARYNAIDVPMAIALHRVLREIAADPTCRAAILTGAGAAFCSGGDLKQVLQHSGGPPAAFLELAAHVHQCIGEIRRLPKPVIAAVNGVAAGGGFSLALACDFRVMSRTATLRQGYTSSGLCIDAGGTHTLPRLVGLARAMEIAAFDEPISADQALAWGLATALAEPDDTLDRARAMAETLSERSLTAFALVKALMVTSFETPLDIQLEREREGIANSSVHADGREGLRAFVEKRAPRFP